MHGIRKTIALSIAATVLSGGMIVAQEHRGDDQHGNDRHSDAGHDNRGYVQHREWKRGARMNRQDWARGERVDYRSRHLNPPPRGYEWRMVDGNYVMAAIATGVIASVIAASAAH